MAFLLSLKLSGPEDHYVFVVFRDYSRCNIVLWGRMEKDSLMRLVSYFNLWLSNPVYSDGGKVCSSLGLDGNFVDILAVRNTGDASTAVTRY